MSSRRVLLAEDDRAVRQLLMHHFARDGFAALEAPDGPSALRTLRDGVDIALLDVALPGVDGFDILRTVRREGLETPVVMLTARVEELDRIVGFELGADDYVIKPFSAREVVARVRAVLRRSGMKPQAGPRALVFGRLEVSEAAREARVDGVDAGLKPREFALLLALAANAGIAMSRDMLLEKVWGYDFDGDERTVDVHVRRIRKRLEEERGLGCVLHTVHGFGYKFSPP